MGESIVLDKHETVIDRADLESLESEVLELRRNVKRAERAAVKMGAAITRALALLGGNQWERCDEETGAECKGARCSFAAHKAAAILERVAVKEKGADNARV